VSSDGRLERRHLLDDVQRWPSVALYEAMTIFSELAMQRLPRVVVATCCWETGRWPYWQ